MAKRSTAITIEQIEALAESLEREDGERRAKLLRMIRAYVRILAIREPDKFPKRATVYADEDGHYDNSYPPSQEWKERTGPRSITLRKLEFESRATETGFYHDTKYYTTVPGVYIDRDGHLLAGTLSGTGSYGQFAAHPGECGVDCTIEFDDIDDEYLSTAEIVEAEQQLRVLAFPASAKKGGR